MLLKPMLYLGGAKSDNKTSLEYFTNKPEYKVLLTTRQAGGEGLNLQTANHIVLLNCWWTVKDIIQILGRIKRKGQGKPVYSYILGYNLFDCIEPGKTPDFYILPEDTDFYSAIRQKREMCENWGIEVETKLPPPKVFFHFSTFEKDFSSFLDQTIIKKIPLIMSEELKEEVDAFTAEYHEKEKEKNRFLERELQAGETLLQYIFFLYYEHCKKLEQKNPVKKKIIVVKKKKQ